MNDYELIVALAEGLRDAAAAGDTERAATIAATLGDELHVQRLVLDPDQMVTAEIIRTNGYIDVERVTALCQPGPTTR